MAQGSVARVPHSCGWILISQGFVEGMLTVDVLKGIAPLKAGEEGWSVIVMEEACARALIIEGSAAPVGVCPC